jgi:hypothetical protein
MVYEYYQQDSTPKKEWYSYHSMFFMDFFEASLSLKHHCRHDIIGREFAIDCEEEPITTTRRAALVKEELLPYEAQIVINHTRRHGVDMGRSIVWSKFNIAHHVEVNGWSSMFWL